MKKLKNKIVGILLTAVMAIGGVMYSGDIVNATNNEDAGLALMGYTSDPNGPPYKPDYKPGTCQLDSDGNIQVPEVGGCMYDNVYYEWKYELVGTEWERDSIKTYPALITATESGTLGLQSLHQPYQQGCKNWEQAKESIEKNHNDPSMVGTIANNYTHYVLIRDNGTGDVIAYARCDFFLNNMVVPGENYKVTYKVYNDENSYLGEEAVEEGKYPQTVPNNDNKFLQEKYPGYEIDYWVNSNGEKITVTEQAIYGPTTFYAVLKPKEVEKYEITYDSNQNLNNTGNQTKTDDEGKKASGERINLDDNEFDQPIDQINEKDVIFIGWSEERTTSLIEKDGTEPNNMHYIDDPWIVEGDKTFYAVWATDENGNEIPDYQEGSITVTKTIDQLTNIDGQGKPIFTFKLISENRKYVDYKIVTMDSDTASVTFDGLPAGTYTITELEGIRYDLASVDSNSDNKIATITIPEYGTNQNQKMSVTFHNTLTVKGNVSDTGSVTNTFSWNGTKAVYNKEIDNNLGGN